ncbi:TPA: inverse autotransporter beta domain-containing protein [Escherichia coli]|uniref:inverse autotransporter beta domain-containing protein n=1 Tax=Escherichia coli TaxID=562 RepID=UPI000DA53F3E|nr:inverse autotransporter beta domain-containing protein [Escherichia coli]EJD4224520.1 inverse autotransporter beta domain-containing protein [Escherichia coli]SQO28014.1 Ig domain-containing protein [Escherichia coli]HCL7088372.1 inverse autotransporter beta domain-containing protein [Escherichia coli]
MSHYKTGHKQPRFRYSVLARCVAWANISVQVLFPLAVTFTPVMAARAQHAVQPRLSMGNTTVTADNNVEKNVASFAANAGTFLSSQPDSDATRNFITGMATAKANQEIQEWLGKYGTARVKLNVDKDFSLKDSSLEMLYPIYDTPTNMLFTQGAIHRTDDRTQSNIGFGWRHFSGNDWMAGVNTFIDHDLSRSHTRIGVGAEYWRDYLKLSANGYIRASGWKKSPDIEDYQERPANGWDIRAEGYLPAWPQLGASLMYEQYYGDEVGLFGKDKRQKDPHAISAEVTYTPVPLLTLSAGHKQGKSGENDTRFGLEVNYRIGEPLAKQLDTDSIRERRVLAGSRYDLVERNNNIVLEYGNLLPGAVVVFNLPRGVKPLADGNIMVNADKEGKAELKVVSVTAGTYEITASAGNDQPSNAQSVTFVADKTTATISSIEVIGNRAVADGKTKQTYKVTVTDANNNLLKDSDVTLTASSENLVLDPKGTAKTNEQGQAVFTGSTTIAATYTLTAKVEQANGQVSTKTAESKFVADDKNAVLAASPERVDSLVADGKTTATMTVTLMAGVNPVGGSMWVDIEAPEGVTEKDYQFLPSKADHFSGGKITRTFSTSKPGVYTFTFNALTYGGYEMTPVKVTINAVAAETENGEEEMP